MGSSASEPVAPHCSAPTPAGLKRIVEGGDGDCLFHAIGRQALGDPNKAAQARAQICDWMTEHMTPSAQASGRSTVTSYHWQLIAAQRSDLSTGGAQDGPVLQYIGHMRRRGEWGTGLEALCAAYCYARPVCIWSPGGFSELRPPAHLVTNMEPIRLLHNGRDHWDSAFPEAGTAASRTSTANRSQAKASTQDDDDAHNLELALALSASAHRAGQSGNSGNHRALALQAAEHRRNAEATRGLGNKAAKPQPKAKGSLTAAPKLKPNEAPASKASTPVPPSAIRSCADAEEHQNGEVNILELKQCVSALQCVGFTEQEANEALSRCDGNVARVKELYCIEWDEHGRTVQMPFAGS